jgi:uncharacterized membrane protein YhaH (DUF805 family)
MNFPDAVKSSFRNWNNFSGRACRSEFWWFTVFHVILVVSSTLFDKVLFHVRYSDTGPIGWFIIVVLFIPNLSQIVRRYHDINKPWKWLLWSIFPWKGWVAGWQSSFFRGTIGPNRYGPDPLGDELPTMQPAP